MSTVEEIQNAIRNLSKDERAQLAESLPALVPELDGDAEWERIINDPTPSPKLTKFLDDIDARLREDPSQFRELNDAEFNKYE
ncbi:MAG TPA: hypothetical protein VK993_11930 [Chthoniobacterales bacterium]|nr:hypothetical protein [Chthoniobacterales bacterium]